MMTITYAGRNSIYVNMTNRCPCACVFCLRHNKDHVFNANSLWLEREPTVKEICDSIDAWDLEKYDEIVFCGYGEPTERLDELLQVASYIKSNRKTKKHLQNTSTKQQAKKSILILSLTFRLNVCTNTNVSTLTH